MATPPTVIQAITHRPLLNLENAPTDLPAAERDGDIFSLRSPFQTILTHVKLTKQPEPKSFLYVVWNKYKKCSKHIIYT